MSSSVIKAIAITAMVIDHLGAVLFPQMLVLRIIGRIALPLFAWQLSVSVDKTHDVKKLLTRIFLFALISHVPYVMLFGYRLNIFFSFTLSVMMLILYKQDKFVGYLALAASLIISQIANVEYGWYAVIMVFLFYFYKDDIRGCLLSQIVINVLYFFMNPGIQPYALLSLLIILFYNNQKGKLYNYRFAMYSIYPVHFIVLALLKGGFPWTSLLS